MKAEAPTQGKVLLHFPVFHYTNESWTDFVNGEEVDNFFKGSSVAPPIALHNPAGGQGNTQIDCTSYSRLVVPVIADLKQLCGGLGWEPGVILIPETNYQQLIADWEREFSRTGLAEACGIDPSIIYRLPVTDPLVPPGHIWAFPDLEAVEHFRKQLKAVVEYRTPVIGVNKLHLQNEMGEPDAIEIYRYPCAVVMLSGSPVLDCVIAREDEYTLRQINEDPESWEDCVPQLLKKIRVYSEGHTRPPGMEAHQ